MSNFCNLYKLLLLAICFGSVLGTISPKDKMRIKKPVKTFKGATELTVFERKLVSKTPKVADILQHHAAFSSVIKDTKNFTGMVLGYVTAWNNHGYDVAKLFANKFDLISPVWLQIVPKADDDNNYVLAGKHDIDPKWMRDLRNSSSRPLKILPRVILDHFTGKRLTALFHSEAHRRRVTQLLIDICKLHNFDGIVLDFWAQVAEHFDNDLLIGWVMYITKSLRLHRLDLVLVIPPVRKGTEMIFGTSHMTKLYRNVYAFSLMSYDYSDVQRPGPNAPIYWIRDVIESIVPTNVEHAIEQRAKLLMGLNMYGNDYTADGGGPIVGSAYIKLVANVKNRLNYDEHDVENFFRINTKTGTHTVFYPSLYSINERIKLANELGCGISIWELGQGLDYFYDLF